MTSMEVAAVDERAFQTQRVDAEWAKQATSELHDGIEKLLPEGALRSVECRATLCRAELVCADAAAVSAFVDGALRAEDRVWKGAASVLKTGETRDGAWEVSAFFAREGTTMPRPD